MTQWESETGKSGGQGSSGSYGMAWGGGGETVGVQERASCPPTSGVIPHGCPKEKN